MNKKNYNELKMSVICLFEEDVITASNEQAAEWFASWTGSWGDDWSNKVD